MSFKRPILALKLVDRGAADISHPPSTPTQTHMNIDIHRHIHIDIHRYIDVDRYR